MKVDYQVGIIGAGFGGIIAGINLLKSNRHSFVIFEKSNEVGGVWRDNIYPGCSCDVRSNFYSIKTEPNPNWSDSYAHQQEIFQYLKQVVKKYKLKDYIQYQTEIVEMRFVESDGYWLVTDHRNRSLKIKTIILATGPFQSPFVPDIPRHESFLGRHFHSSSWDVNCNLSGLNVAVIGTGASSIQIVPNIAKNAGKLFVFQRSPAWILPRWGSKKSSLIKKAYKSFPFIQRLVRETNYWFLEFIGLGFLGHKKMHKLLTKVALRKLKKEVADPVTRAKLTPSYSFGCKRVLLSDDFYSTFNKPNVQLITDSIDRITKNKIYTNSGEAFDVDVIIYATGFKVADIDKYIRIIGRNKRELTIDWNKNGPEAYFGITVTGYPNLCFLLGPNSGLSHSSALHIIESQMTYVLKYILEIEKNGNDSFLDVKSELQKEYNLKLQRELKNTTWSSGCSSWYINKNGKNIVINPHLTFHYRKSISKLKMDDYLILNANSIFKLHSMPYVLSESEKHKLNEE